MSQPNTIRRDAGAAPAPAPSPDSVKPATEKPGDRTIRLAASGASAEPAKAAPAVQAPANGSAPEAKATGGVNTGTGGNEQAQAPAKAEAAVSARSFARLSKEDIDKERKRLAAELKNLTVRDNKIKRAEQREAAAKLRRARDDWRFAVAAGIADAGLFDYEKGAGLVTPEVVIGHALELLAKLKAGAKADIDALARSGAAEIERQKAAKAKASK